MNERSVFLEALEKVSLAERSAYLDQACAGDPALRRKVEELLEAHEQAGKFLDSAVARAPSTVSYQPITEGSGSRIGPYKLLQKIGEGGMGVVYMAEQEEPVRRRVALKIIKPGMDTSQVIARFEAERQALAMMDHQNIARVLDAGATETGRPFFVMELVKGVPITQYCDQNHLTPRERLQLFLPVCQAIQHAHQKGIIHRDIKPSNVMVTLYDGKAVPKMIDFGVAKAIAQPLTERTMFTEYGQIVGTIEYMSPEQAEMSGLDIDTRSDIYSLGVLLYELLTGTTPFDRIRLRAAAFDEMLRIIREEEPPNPSTRLSTTEEIANVAASRKSEPAKLAKLVRGELDWIVMKSLEKDRTRRYETASGLAQDIQRYLTDEPVLAGPPSAVYRLRKYAWKHKKALATVAGFAILLVGATAVSIGLAAWALSAEQQARGAAEAEADQRKLAQDSEKEANKRADEIRAVLEFMENQVFAAARPEGQAGGLGRDVTMRQAIEAALPHIEGRFPAHPLIEARLRHTIGTSFWYLGDAKTAERQLTRARELRAAHLGPDHPDTLRSVLSLANTYADMGRHAEALKLREEALPLLKAKLGRDHPHTLFGMNNLANSYQVLGRHADAMKLREEMVELSTAKSGSDHPDTLSGMNNLANSYYFLGRREEALKLYEKTLELRKAALGPNHPDTLTSMTNVATSYHALGRHEDALRLRERQLPLMKARLGLDHPHTLAAMNNIATSYYALGRHAEALKLLEETLRLKKAKLGPDHPDTLRTMSNVGTAYYELGQHSEALRIRDETLQLRKTKLGPDHPDTLRSMWAMAESLVELNRDEEAVSLIDDCLKIAAGKVVDPRLIPKIMDTRLRVFQKKKDSVGCLETADRWEALKRSDATSLYQAARFRAVCAAAVKEERTPKAHAPIPGANATQRAKQQADLAMAWLNKAVAAGYKDAAHMKKDKDLDALRDREDFKKLLTELETAKPAAPAKTDAKP